MASKKLILFMLAFCCLLNVEVKAQVAFVPLRGQTESICEMLKTYLRETTCRMIKVQTKEFDNGNTFVQFEADVRGKSVAIVLKESMTANEEMETLIKIRTAKSMGARYIDLFVPVNTDELTINRLAVAGADRIVKIDGIKVIEERGAEILSKPQGPEFPGERETIIFSENHLKLANEIGSLLGTKVIKDFSDLTRYVSGKAGRVNIIFIEAAAPEVNERILTALDQIRTITAYGANVHLMTPYFPYSRSDKVDQFGVAVTGRLIADLIEDAGVSTAIFSRLHAPQVQGFFRIPTIHITGRATVADYLRPLNVDAVISPDAGFQKEATLYAGLLDKPVFVLNKQRDPKTGKSIFKKMGSFRLKGKTVAIIDDETATGGTLAEAATFLKKNGAVRVIGIVTHLAGGAQKALDSGDLDEIVVANTLPIRAASFPKLKVLSIGPESAHELRGLLGGEDVTCDSLLAN